LAKRAISRVETAVTEVGAYVRVSLRAELAHVAGQSGLNRNSLSDETIRDTIANTLNNSSGFVAQYQSLGDSAALPVVAVGPADASADDLDEHFVHARRRDWSFFNR
jgi:hypothetical protein